MICCLCHENDFEYLWTNLEKKSPRHSSIPLDVQICRTCGLVSLDISDVTPSSVKEYYETSNTFERPGPLPEGHKQMRVEQVEWVLSVLPEDHGVKAVLDVGCGAGYVLKLFKDKGFDVMGTDYSPAMIKNLKETYAIEGVQGGFSAELLKGRTFDMVSCICVLEHMLDPYEVLQEMNRIINPGGYLFIEVPDVEHPRWDTIVDHLAYDHIWHFSERTLGHLFEECGFEVIGTTHVENPPQSGNPECIIRIAGKKKDVVSRKYSASDYDFQKKVLAEYKANHAKYINEFQKTIDAIADKAGGAPMAIFPGGEHSATLFKRFDLSKLNIQCVFDNDKAVVGKEIEGFPIRHGSEAGDGKTIRHFLLSTTNHEIPISQDLKAKDPDCKTYGLYNQLD